MKILSLSLLAAIIVLTSGCKESTSPSNPFSGSWNFLFDGDYAGQGTATIDDQGRITLSPQFHDAHASPVLTYFTVTISGTVDNSGSLTATMSRGGDQNFGIMIGTISGTHGNGIDTVSSSSRYGLWSGTWTAAKN